MRGSCRGPVKNLSWKDRRPPAHKDERPLRPPTAQVDTHRTLHSGSHWLVQALGERAPSNHHASANYAEAWAKRGRTSRWSAFQPFAMCPFSSQLALAGIKTTPKSPAAISVAKARIYPLVLAIVLARLCTGTLRAPCRKTHWRGLRMHVVMRITNRWF